MHVFSELVEAQLENKASDPTPGVKGKVYYKSTTEPIKVDDGTTIHKVLTDQMYPAIKTAVNPSNYTIAASNSGTWSVVNNPYTDITNQSVSITTTGRPVEITILGGNIEVSSGNAGAFGKIKALRDATSLDEINFGQDSGSVSALLAIPASSFRWVDTPAAGTYTYKLQAEGSFSGHTVRAYNIKIMAREL